MATRDIVVIGASSGGVEALRKVVGGLPRDLPAAIFVVQHVSADSTDFLPRTLNRESPLKSTSAEHGAAFERGHIYVAPPDRHLLIDSDQMFLSNGPRENRVRPAVDPLFRSAALSHGHSVIGVVLSGALDDGTAGLATIKKLGGLAIVQEPEDAASPSMPQSACDYVSVDHRIPAAEIGSLLGRLVGEEIPAELAAVGTAEDLSLLGREIAVHLGETGIDGIEEGFGAPVSAGCPECGGPLWQMDQDFPRFRCHTGHAFTARNLVAGLQAAEEQSLWVALRVMEERARMLRRLADQQKGRGRHVTAGDFAQKAAETEQHVVQLRRLLGNPP